LTLNYQIVPLNPGNTSGVISPAEFRAELKLLGRQLVAAGSVQLAEHVLPSMQELVLSENMQVIVRGMKTRHMGRNK
jgi:hypothetical protein